MGESAAQTLREIEDTRNRLEGDLRELEDRLPAPVGTFRRLVGIAVGGGLAGTLLLTILRWARRRRRGRDPVRVEVRLITDRDAAA